MARKPGKVRRDGDTIWLDIGLAASLLGTTRRKLVERAIAGEFRYQENKFGLPVRVAEPDVAPLRAAKLAAERAKAPRKPRPKTPEQQEANGRGSQPTRRPGLATARLWSITCA
jgi:hypothetical protein